MKNTLLLLAVLAFFGCEQQAKLTYTERRLIGSWTYDEVDFTKKWSFGKNDITNEYEDFILTFNDDFTVILADPSNGDSWSGIWEINITTINSDETTNSNEQLLASLKNDQTGELMHMVWDCLSVNKRRIDAQNTDKEGYYHFRLKKI